MAAMVSRAALAAKKKKGTIKKVCKLWEACTLIKDEEVRHVPPSEVAAALQEVNWQPEYSTTGKNTDVRTQLIT